ncbi:MAG: hypothetical protein ACTSR2_01275 [Candidatus Hodarchaeales archaeon]
MSSWQSFFNELTKPSKTQCFSSTIQSTTTEICRCNKGSLEFSKKDLDYRTIGNCSFSSACCVIQVDKHRVRGLNSSRQIISFDA